MTTTLNSDQNSLATATVAVTAQPTSSMPSEALAKPETKVAKEPQEVVGSPCCGCCSPKSSAT